MAKKSEDSDNRGEKMESRSKRKASEDEEEEPIVEETDDVEVIDSPERAPSPPTLPPPPPPTPLECHLVGGPLLGKRSGEVPSHNNIASWGVFEPIITPEIASENRKKPERFILLPHSEYITVLAYRTGVKIATLVPVLNSHDDDDDDDDDNDDDDVLIQCVGLARYHRKLSETTVQDVLERMEAEEAEGINYNGTAEIVEEVVVLVGCQDGSIREFSLKELTNRVGTAEKVDCGPYKVSGPCFHPRRVIRTSNKHPITHLTVPHLNAQVKETGFLVYLASVLDNNVGVHRIRIPHYDGSANVTLSDTEGENQGLWQLDKFVCDELKGKAVSSTLPFKILSVAKPLSIGNTQQRTQEYSIFIVLARSNAIAVYYDQYDSNEIFEPMRFSMPGRNPLTAIDISLNKADITCGHYKGNIRVLNNLINDVEQYHIAMGKAKQLGSNEITKRIINPSSPKYKMITSRVHWHALPVSSLVYDSISSPVDPLLYSGGDESVLVTWQISQGRDRPVDVQPRLALGGIIHLSSSDICDNNAANGVLVFCEDNTLQLLETYNKGQVWKIQGLAGGFTGEVDNEDTTGVNLEIDPRSDGPKASQLVITGLPQAPGYIHWFNPNREMLSSSLEVAPFNRISRTEPDELPLPKPRITCHSFSAMGEDLITVDEYPTENAFVGAPEERKNGETYGIVTTIRFWCWKDTSSAVGSKGTAAPYNQIASMTFPHGPKNRVSAIGISKDGSVACTVSHNEKAFRVWQKQKSHSKAADPASEPDFQPYTWVCRYKVSIPAGFSNFSTGKNGVSFSEDSSILAVSFGQFATLWDADDARLLTSFYHCFGKSDIERVQFVNPGLHRDLLLVQSAGGVTLRSLYGGQNGCSASFDAWTFAPRQTGKNCTIVTATKLIESHACIAISLYSPNKKQSSVVLIDSQSGSTGIRPIGSVKGIDGRILALSSSGIKWQGHTIHNIPNDEDDSAGNNDEESKNKKPSPVSPLSLYALTNVGNLFLFTEDPSAQQQNTTTTTPRRRIFIHQESMITCTNRMVLDSTLHLNTTKMVVNDNGRRHILMKVMKMVIWLVQQLLMTTKQCPP